MPLKIHAVYSLIQAHQLNISIVIHCTIARLAHIVDIDSASEGFAVLTRGRPASPHGQKPPLSTGKVEDDDKKAKAQNNRWIPNPITGIPPVTYIAY